MVGPHLVHLLVLSVSLPILVGIVVGTVIFTDHVSMQSVRQVIPGLDPHPRKVLARLVQRL